MATAIGTQIIMSLRGVDNLSGVLAGAGRNVAAFARSSAASGTMAAQSLSLSAGAVRGLYIVVTEYADGTRTTVKSVRR